ncbi:putative pyruvate dehydrogenase E1 component (Alpha subunit) pdhA [Mycobacterium intracellulare]|nr:putative pyruvate dehydrogenase E1 component (Alpha subunit) pdhA [Mycobacterium intracellulare]
MAQMSSMRMAVDLEPVQLVAADGSPTPERRYGRDLPAETLSWLYELMVITGNSTPNS